MTQGITRLSELLYLALPTLPTTSQKSDSILISNSTYVNGDSDDTTNTSSKWEDEEERRFYEDIQDLKDFVPSSVIGIELAEVDATENKETEKERAEKEKEEVRKLEEELEKLNDGNSLKKDEEPDEEE